MTNDRDLTDDELATDPGSLSEVAAATSNEAAEKALESSRPAYTDDPDGTDPHASDAPGAGRGAVSELDEG